MAGNRDLDASGSGARRALPGEGTGMSGVVELAEQLAVAEKTLEEAVELIRELSRFLPYEKPEQGPLPVWIVSLRDSVDRFLADHEEATR